MVESRQGSNLLYLPLDKIMQMTGGTTVPLSPDAMPAAVSSAPLATNPVVPAPVPTIDPRARDARTR